MKFEVITAVPLNTQYRRTSDLVKFEVITAVPLNTQILRAVTLTRLVNISQVLRRIVVPEFSG